MNLTLVFVGFILFTLSIYFGVNDEYVASLVTMFFGTFAIVRGGSKLLDGRSE